VRADVLSKAVGSSEDLELLNRYYAVKEIRHQRIKQRLARRVKHLHLGGDGQLGEEGSPVDRDGLVVY
jgi:hypothetical protein